MAQHAARSTNGKADFQNRAFSGYKVSIADISKCRGLVEVQPQRYDTPMIGRQLENLLNSLFVDAKTKRHEFLTVEHLLLGLTDEAEAFGMLEHAGGDIDELRAALTQHIETTVAKLIDPEKETHPTVGFQRDLQRAVFHVQSSARKEVRLANVLIAIFSEADGEAVALLNQQGIKRMDIIEQMANAFGRQ